MIHWSLVLLLQFYAQQTVRPQRLQFLKTANAEIKGSGHVDFEGPIGRLYRVTNMITMRFSFTNGGGDIV